MPHSFDFVLSAPAHPVTAEEATPIFNDCTVKPLAFRSSFYRQSTTVQD